MFGPWLHGFRLSGMYLICLTKGLLIASIVDCSFWYAPVAQWIEQQPSKLWVARSSRAGGENRLLIAEVGFWI